MKPTDLFVLVAAALAPLDLDLRKDRDKRVYLAYVAARVGAGENGALERRLTKLRGELGL